MNARFGHLLGLEQAFTVVYWDQRGCGRSLRGRQDRAGISVERMAVDTVLLLEFLRDRFGAKTYVAGFSFGGTVGAAAAARRPDLVATLVAVGMDIDGAAAGTAAYDFALAAARQRGSRRATRQLQAIGPPPHLTSRQFAARQPGALTGLFGRGCLPDRPRYQRDTGRAAARARGHGPGPHPAPPGGARRHGAGPP
jgi:pimeloyl-ACP methyl ester carboxylesterase